MELELEALLESVSQSVQRAQQALDLDAEQHFCEMVRTPLFRSDGGKDGQIPVLGRTEIPAAALMHHMPMLLEEVSIDMSVYLRSGETGIMAELAPPVMERQSPGESGAPAYPAPSTIHLTYKKEPASEGIARITNQLNKDL